MSLKPVQKGLMGLLALLMVGGMAYQFTPALSGGQGLFNQQKGTPALKVNGETISAEDLEAARKGNPILASTDKGVLADDFRTFVVAQQVLQRLYVQGAKDIDVSRDDVSAEIKKIRDSQNLQDNKAWTDWLQARNLSDSKARSLMRDQLAVQRKVEQLQKAAPIATEAELQAYYNLNKEQYKTDPQIVGRDIVVSDKAKAAALLAQLKAGGDFAALATANSLENKERGGALGPLENGAPKPVSGVVLPTEVADAALALTAGGLTDVIASGGKFYIVKVEKFLPPVTKTFEQAKSTVQSAVDQQKKDAAVEAWVDGLKKNVQLEVIDPTWKTYDPVVASVGGQNIPYSEVVAQVINNQQVAAIFQQLPPEQAAGLINGFKPQLVQQLLMTYGAPAMAKKLNLNLLGNRQEQAQALALYGAKDVTVSDADIQKAYQENIQAFQTPGSATVDEASFKDKNQAAAFQADWDGKSDFVAAASKAGGTVSERGEVTQGASKLDPKLLAAVFGSGLRSVGEGSLSEVAQVGERYSVAYVRDLKKPTTKPLTEVRSQVEQQVLTTKRSEASQSFMQKQLAELKPVDNLQKVLDEQAKRIAAAEPAATPATGTPATGTPATGEGATTAPATETAPAAGSTPADKTK